MPATKIYLIPGLGLDGRIFQKLELPGYDVHWLPWLEPESMRESLQSFAQRMIANVDASGSDVILGGHSFGGIMAQEMARLMPVKKVLLISSIKSGEENNPMFVKAGKWRLYHLFFKWPLTRKYFHRAALNGHGNEAEHLLVDEMYRKTTSLYLRWGCKQLAFWEPTPLNIPIVHIHGKRDHTFPFKYIREPVVPVEKAWHFMVYQRAEKVCALIQSALR